MNIKDYDIQFMIFDIHFIMMIFRTLVYKNEYENIFFCILKHKFTVTANTQVFSC